MSMLTMRRTIARHKAIIAKSGASVALFATAAFVIVSTNGHPGDAVARPAALALTSPVVATSRPTLSYLANASLVQPSAMPVAANTPSNPSPSWELANISNPRVDKWVGKFTT